MMSNQRLSRSDSVLVCVLIKDGPPLIKEVGPSQRRDHHGHDTECNQWLRRPRCCDKKFGSPAPFVSAIDLAIILII